MSWRAGSPDLVVNTGDNLAHPRAVPAVVQALGDLLSVPGVFVFGSNDYFGPQLKNPANYVTNPGHRVHGEPLPWQDLRAAFTERGWLDMTHTRRELEVGGLTVAAAGVDDPHLSRDRYDTIAGPASPAANLTLGLTHSPEPRVLDRFAADGYQLVMAGHTHGGQLCLPFYGAIVTNCGLDRSRAKGASQWGARTQLHVSAGIGTSPFYPVRFCCRPEATLLTLVAAPIGGRAVTEGRERASERRAAVTDGRRPRSQPRAWVDNAVRFIEADARRSADTHLLRYPLPTAWCDGRRRPALPQGRDDAHHRQPQAPTGALAVPVRAVQRLDQRGHHRHRGVVGVDGRFGGVLRALAGPAVHRGDAVVDQRRQDRTDRISGRPLPFRGEESVRCTRKPNGWRGRPAGITWISSPMPSARPTGAATTTSPSRYSPDLAEQHPIPEWIVVGAGTGGTSATIGRYIRYRRYAPGCASSIRRTRRSFRPMRQARDVMTGISSRIEGIGRPRVEPSFLPDVVDRMVSVPDAASVAAARHVSAVLGRRVGPSTGTNLWGAFGLLAEMIADGRSGSVVTLLADSGDRYADTYFCDDWLAERELDPTSASAMLIEFERTGSFG